MRCIGCGSTAVSERSERTTQGYRRFRCRDCGKQFNERSESLLNRTQYPSDIIALVVFWRLPAWCMDQLIDAGRPVGLGGPRISTPDVRRAVQAKPGSPPPHPPSRAHSPAPAAQGHEL